MILVPERSEQPNHSPMFRPIPHGVAGPYDELIYFGLLILSGLLYLGLYFASGRNLKNKNLKNKKDQQNQD